MLCHASFPWSQDKLATSLHLLVALHLVASPLEPKLKH
jgi:hypothetical protein